jgi:hypothetical protein
VRIRFDELQTDQGGDQIDADLACRRLREVLHEAVAGIDQQQQDKYREKAQQDLADSDSVGGSRGCYLLAPLIGRCAMG